MTRASARIAVIGAGLMGHGIAQVSRRAGHRVRGLRRASGRAREPARRASRANLRRPRPSRRIAGRGQPVTPISARRCAAREFVIEARRKNCELKQAIFAELETAARRRRGPAPQHLGDPDHRDRRAACATRARIARHALVEPAVPRAARRSRRHGRHGARASDRRRRWRCSRRPARRRCM